MITKELAGCVLLDEQSRVSLIHRNTPRLTQWELPGGKVEAGESLEQAAQREVLEEIGVQAGIVRKIGETIFEDNGTHWHYTWFLTKVIDGVPEALEDSHDGVRYFDLADSDIERHGISINIVHLITAFQNKSVHL